MKALAPICLLAANLGGCASAAAQAPLGTAPTPSAGAGEAAIRAQLAAWLEASRRRDAAGMAAAFDPNAVCWLPEAPQLSNAAAARLVGTDPSQPAWSSYDLAIDRIDVSGDLGVVHDIWTETRHFAGTPRTATRRLRGSELWRLQADGRWRIIRCVSAPDPWRIDSGQADAAGPASEDAPATVARREIQGVIEAGLDATRRGDAAAFLARVPADFRLDHEDGRSTGRAELEAALRERFRNPPQTVRLDVVIERLELEGGQARIWTLQSWERIARAATALAGRRVLTTQRHEERWRRRDGRWEAYRIRELGGQMFVDGALQDRG